MTDNHNGGINVQKWIYQAIYILMLVSVVAVTFSVAVSSITFGSAVILWFYLIVTKGKVVFPRTPFDFLFLFYLLAEILTTIFSQEPINSLINMKRLFLISFIYLVLVSVDNEKRLKVMLGILVTSAAVLSLVEIVLQSPVGGHFARLSLFQYVTTEGGIKMIILLLLLPFVIHPSTPRNLKIFASISSLPLLVALILTQTRSSWLGLVAGVLTIGMIKSKKVILVLILLIIIFILFAPADIHKRAASIFDPTMSSNLSRIHMITTGWRMFLDRPMVGFGDVDLRKYYVTYITPIDEAEGGHLHNNFMMLLVTLGIIGFAVTMTIFVAIFIKELKAVHITSNHWLYGSITLGSFAAYIGFHVNGLFEWNYGDHEVAVLFWFTVGLVLVSQKMYQQLTRQQ